jgi:F-type H+-transporting ATPase subunit delta
MSQKMSQSSTIAKNYAKALFEAVKEGSKNGNKIAKIKEDFAVFNKNFSSDFANELSSPALSKKDLLKIAGEICKKMELSGVFADFIAIVFQNKRVNAIKEIYAEFINLVKIEEGIISAEIISAAELDESEISKLKDAISSANKGKKVEIKQTIKSQILGGVQIKIGSNLIDASLKTKLKNIQNALIEAIN